MYYPTPPFNKQNQPLLSVLLTYVYKLFFDDLKDLNMPWKGFSSSVEQKKRVCNIQQSLEVSSIWFGWEAFSPACWAILLFVLTWFLVYLWRVSEVEVSNSGKTHKPIRLDPRGMCKLWVHYRAHCIHGSLFHCPSLQFPGSPVTLQCWV